MGCFVQRLRLHSDKNNTKKIYLYIIQLLSLDVVCIHKKASQIKTLSVFSFTNFKIASLVVFLMESHTLSVCTHTYTVTCKMALVVPWQMLQNTALTLSVLTPVGGSGWCLFGKLSVTQGCDLCSNLCQGKWFTLATSQVHTACLIMIKTSIYQMQIPQGPKWCYSWQFSNSLVSHLWEAWLI